MSHDDDLTALRADALDECQRCHGREHGDCSDQCQFFALTASPGELEAIAKLSATWKPWNTMRPVEWPGGRQSGEFCDATEAA